MSWQCPGSWKRCGTCEYWAGVRQISMPFCHYVLVENGCHGQCTNTTSGWFRQQMQESHVCSKYQKWGVIK